MSQQLLLEHAAIARIVDGFYEPEKNSTRYERRRFADLHLLTGDEIDRLLELQESDLVKVVHDADVVEVEVLEAPHRRNQKLKPQYMIRLIPQHQSRDVRSSGLVESLNPAIRKRLHKYRRDPEAAEKMGRLQITDRSLEIIANLSGYKILPTSLLLKLTSGYHKITSRHLQMLFHRGLINRFTFPRIGNPGEFHYYLDNTAALELLVEHGWAEKNALDYNEVRRNREKDYSAIHDPELVEEMQGRLLFLKHEVMISRFQAMLELACRSSGGKVELADFRQGPELWNSVEVSKVVFGSSGEMRETDQKEILPHRPDAFFTLRFAEPKKGREVAHFFYEADRKHTSQPKFNRKLRAHFNYIVKQRKQVEQYGIERIRAVLVETLDAQWAESLRSSASHPIVSGPAPTQLFWFTTSSLFTRPVSDAGSIKNRSTPLFLSQPEIILSRIWATPANDTLHSLLD